MQLDDTIPFFMRYLTHHNPFVHDLDSVLAIARKATLTNRGDFVYSNLGTALLGHALAAAAHRDYVELVQQRLLTPLGMSATTLPLTAKDLPNDALTGYSADGVAEAPWTINGWAPAGGARSTPRDMVRYARALLDGSAPGMDALTPQWDFGAQQIGYAWQTQLYALWAIMGAFVWRWAGFNTVIYLAGLQSIPREYHEAAMIEGAGGLPRFRHITWPLLLPYTYTVVLLTTMGTLRIFDLMWIMTQGGPAHATETIATYIFTIAFRFLRVGYAQSLAFILLALVVLLTLLLTLTLRKRANEAFS
jgi:CubicO group peptidase (beta-lactamase class C family)